MGPLKHSKIYGYSPLESAGAVRDAVKGEPRILMTGQGGVKIENYRKILFYSDTCIRIQTFRRVLAVTGTRLMIRYYDRDEMWITGRVEVVRFE